MTSDESTKPKVSSARLLRRILLWTGVIFLSILVLTLIFLGEIAEYAIEKYDYKYTGRQIEIHDVDFNLIKGRLEIARFQFYEQDAQNLFVDIKNVVADVKPFKLMKNELWVEEASIERMIANVSHTYDKFNYDDLLQRFLPDSLVQVDTTESSAIDLSEWFWHIENIIVDSCRFEYRNNVLESRVVMDPFNLYCPLVSSESDTVIARSDLKFERGGLIDGELLVDVSGERYYFDLLIDHMPIHYLYLYLRDYVSISDFGGFLDVDIDATGSIRTVSDAMIHGNLGTSSLYVNDMEQDTLFSMDSMLVEVLEIDHSQSKYDIGSMLFHGPYIRYEIYPEGDIITQLLKFDLPQDSSEISDFSIPGREYFNVFVYITDYVQLLLDQYENSAYKVDSIGIDMGTIEYVDHTMEQEARFLLEDISMGASGLDSDDDRITFDIFSRINKKGEFDAVWSFDPKDALEMELTMTTRDFVVSSVSPYSFHNTAYPFNYGDAFYEGNIIIHDRKIESENRIFIEDIEVGRKGFADPPVKLPVRLAVAILRDVDGNIELELPISGDLEDPNFNYWPAVLAVLTNTLEKIVTAPFRLLSDAFSTDESDLTHIPWTYGQIYPEKEQYRRVKTLGKILDAKPELSVTYTKLNNTKKEEDYVALFSAKSDYYRVKIIEKSDLILTEDDTVEIAKISTQDSLFLNWLNEKVTAEVALSPTELARRYFGEEALARDIDRRSFLRDSTLAAYALNELGMDRTRFVLLAPDSLDVDTFNLAGPEYRVAFQLTDEVFPPDSLQLGER